MFSYHGSKSKIIHLYPRPKHDTIIEPFCGSARYALKYWEKDVILSDTSPYVVAVWKYLLQASEKDILSLPELPSYQNIDEYPDTKYLSDAEKYFMGFCLCRGKSIPRKTGHAQNDWKRDYKNRVAGDLHKIKHWKFIDGGFEKFNLLDNKATWFIDPPYQKIQQNAKMRYFHWKIDFKNLAQFVETRRGQIIVCEGSGADWIAPLNLLTIINGMSNNYQFEYIYHADRD